VSAPTVLMRAAPGERELVHARFPRAIFLYSIQGSGYFLLPVEEKEEAQGEGLVVVVGPREGGVGV